ncbi:MAG: heparan-alpha-glucosaminide N-acetyltransferase domain-containing protein, partial [Gemmatimonadaceae bacterium]
MQLGASETVPARPTAFDFSAPSASVQLPRPGSRAARVASVDIVRGAIMVLMALDHIRDYTTKLRIRPEDLTQSSVALFATRWVTHFCAPGFSLLAGVGIGLAMNRGKSAREMSRFLV